jgi:hypothetical protein
MESKWQQDNVVEVCEVGKTETSEHILQIVLASEITILC